MGEPEELKRLRFDLESLKNQVARLEKDLEHYEHRDAPEPVREPEPEPAPAPKPAPAPAGKRVSTEAVIGEKVLQYVGLFLLALGALFFVVWRSAHSSPLERVLGASALGAALLYLSHTVRSRPPYDKHATGLAGGGWTILYLTAWAAHHVPLARVIDSPLAGFCLVVAAAAAMVAHALSLDSKGARMWTFGLAFFVLLLSRSSLPDFNILLLLLAGAVMIGAATGHADIVLVSLLGYLLNYAPEFGTGLFASRHALSGENFLRAFAPLTGAYALTAGIPFWAKARAALASNDELPTLDKAMTLATVATAAGGCLLTAKFFPGQPLPTAAVGLIVGAVGVGHRMVLPAAGVSRWGAYAGAAGTALGALMIDSKSWRMVAWVLTAGFWSLVGLKTGAPAYRQAGFLMGLFSFILYASAARRADGRAAAAQGLMLYAALSYLSARFYRTWVGDAIERWEEKFKEGWLYTGTAALLLALWGLLDSAAFALAGLGLCVVGESAAARFGRRHLWLQAAWLELFFGGYLFLIDHGANLPLFAGVTPLALCGAAYLAVWAHFYFEDAPDAGKAWQRRWLSWAALAVFGYSVYHTFGPRARLPAWALSTLGLYALGRGRADDLLKTLAVVLAAGTLFEGFTSYLYAPGALLASPGAFDVAVYWGSTFALLGAFGLAARDEGSLIDSQARFALAALSMAMMTFFLGKELESYFMTLSWGVVGGAYLAGGLTLERKELRWPALALLGITVGKAVLLDTAHLALPYRVLSFVVLGGILVAASMLYVRARKDED